MDVGVVFPQTEIGTDPETVREYARRAESLGFDHLLAYDHVVGVDPDRPGWDGAYDYEDQFHEPLTLYSHLSAVTEDLEFVTGVLVAPQRQTALIAKQAAQVDRYSGGNFRLGIGVGWNEPEYDAMGMDFHSRGRRVEEQVDLLRQLFTEELVEFDGEFHHVPRAGINPLPVQRPIPIWMGGMADPVLRRIGRVADGWLPPSMHPDDLDEELAAVAAHAEDAGRDPDEVGIHARVTVDRHDVDWTDVVGGWADRDADYVAINHLYRGFGPDDHLESLGETADRLDERGLL